MSIHRYRDYFYQVIKNNLYGPSCRIKWWPIDEPDNVMEKGSFFSGVMAVDYMVVQVDEHYDDLEQLGE